MCRSIRLAACVVLLGLLLSTLVLSLGTNPSTPREGTPYFSALANAGIPSVLAQENSCPHQTLICGPHGPRCVNITPAAFCDLGQPCDEYFPCP
jgi:hypothetical protein